jgi:CubicO group peptidase (beta-lactamase class C family)
VTRREILFAGLSLAIQKQRWDEAVRLIDAQTASGALRAACLYVRQGGSEIKKSFGQARDPDAVFLMASITKPMTCTAVMTLVEKKQVSLEDPVRKYIPEFSGSDRDKVLVRHLLSHSSGLPDMLPENDALRKQHAPLKEFVALTCKTPLLFPPGSKVQYQSMGILLAAEILQRVTSHDLSDYLRARVFQPLGMTRTSLDLGGRPLESTMQSQVEADPDWNWNSPYWRNLGAPWGGAHSTVGDTAKFLAYFAVPDSRVLKPETAKTMITDQNAGLNQRYGIGWALSGKKFGKGCSERTFGHSGSTGTLCWHDPAQDLSFVLLTTKPAAQSNAMLIKPVSDAISAP